MNGLKHLSLVLVTAGTLVSGVAEAALHDRGGGLLYDDVLNITWLQDANYAKTSGYDTDGKMTWQAANTWAENLVYYDSVRKVSYSDWRLPAVAPVNGSSFDYSISFNGQTDVGFNITSPNSEMAYMYYVNLGLKGAYAANSAFQPDHGPFGNGIAGLGQSGSVGQVQDYQSWGYWSATAYAAHPGVDAWSFYASNGAMIGNATTLEFYAWAVRPGDVAAAVAEPETYAMMLAGLGFLGAMARRRKA